MEDLSNNLFPIRMEVHIVLALLALLVFGLQFIRFRKKHHLVLAIALPCTMLPYIEPENTLLFNVVGVIEAVALVAALVLTLTVDREKKKVLAESSGSDKDGNTTVVQEKSAETDEEQA